MAPSYYVVKAFSEEIVSRERLREEIKRLKKQPQVHSRVCVECSGADLEFRGDAHNLLSHRIRRVCKRCGCESTRLTNGAAPMFLYNAFDLTEHMSYFGVADGRMVAGIDTTWGWGPDREIYAIRRMLMG